MHPSLNVDQWLVSDHEVMIADGQQAKVMVRNGRLQIIDGVPGHLRQRELPKVPREVTRLIILAHQGFITFEALRWCLATRTQVTHIAEDITMSSGSAIGDWRIIRKQAERDLVVTRYLLSRKVRGQASALFTALGKNRTSDQLTVIADAIQHAIREGLEWHRACEGNAASLYWRAWQGSVRLWWSPSDVAVVPSHWRSYPGRPNLLNSYDSNRGATDPVNAMLNYAYKVLESETLIACRLFGFHPDIGVLHANGTDRHAFVLDLMEPIRPFCDTLVLQLISKYSPPAYFDRRWCHELGNGRVMLDPPLSHEIAGWAMDIGAEVRSVASLVRELYKT